MLLSVLSLGEAHLHQARRAARYCEDCGVAQPTEDATASFGVRPYVIDPERAGALWARSEELFGERFPLN